MKRNREEDFWFYVDKRGGWEQCWPWLRSVTRDGYGQWKLDGRSWRTHRLAYFLVVGVDPAEQFVLHSCDNPRCCNPRHLSLGDHTENMRQRQDRGRTARCLGEDVSTAKLTLPQVREIRQRIDGGEPYPTIAARFGVDRSLISHIRHGRAWSHA